MIIGIPKEIKDKEFRVGATPTMCRGFVHAGHTVHIEKGAGEAIDFSDQDYIDSGAIISWQEGVWESELIIKVKEPQESEFAFMFEGQIIFCYLHLAPDPKLTQALIDKRVIAIAYETVVDLNAGLPLLKPMSEIAGRISVQAGAYSLQMAGGGRGVLLGGVPGILPAQVVVVGGGVVGTQAATMAMGMGADVTLLDNNLDRLRELDALHKGRLKTLYSTPEILQKILLHADLVIGAVLIPGKLAPSLISEKMVQSMKKGSVVVDVSIDQGGCIATSRPTTHSNPTFILHNVVHYCVANMPGACARTATQALTNATYPYALRIANQGVEKALGQDALFLEGLNVYKGMVTNSQVAHDLKYKYFSLEKVF